MRQEEWRFHLLKWKGLEAGAADRVVVLQAADLSSILGTPYGPLNPARSDP